MTDIPPAIRAVLEGKNHELRQHHYNARIGNYQGSRVQAVRDALDGWNPEPGTPLHALWTQIQQATELYETEINNIRHEASRDIPGIDTGTPRDIEDRVAFHLAANDHLCTVDEADPEYRELWWRNSGKKFRADYLRHAREVIAIVHTPA